MGTIKDIHQLPNDVSKALNKTRICFFQLLRSPSSLQVIN